MTISDVNRSGSVDGSEATAAASKTTCVVADCDEEVKSSVVFVGCNDDDDDCGASSLREQDCSQQERHRRDETAAEHESPIHMVVTTNSSEEEGLETDTTAASTIQAPSQAGVRRDRSFQHNQQHPTRPRLRPQRRRSINTNTTSYSRLSVASGRRHRLHPGQRHTQNSWITSFMFLIPIVVFFVRKIFFNNGHQILILPLFFTLIAIGGVGMVATLLICLQDRLEEWITKPPKHSQQNQPPSLPPLVDSASTNHDSSSNIPNEEDQTETKDHRHTKNITNTTKRKPPPSQDVVSPSFALSSKPVFHVSPSHHNNHQNNGSDHDTTTTTTSAKSLQLQQQQQQQPLQKPLQQRPPMHRRHSSSSLLPPRTSSPCLNSITEGQMEDEFDFWWRELDSQTKYFALLLGYTQKTWDEDYELEDLECENYYWDELTPEQQAAAIYFGCDPDEWDSE
ncbi:hypothetical protein IV203_013992 [Nitzschia inconspicua]|uniref:Uncharacterized protein n=1 Tax=Nitzschia inconspicua TaxID=303405 RepID=A0A9K3M6H3_9STRA|nr:hypothetical protein IV203_014227 [Nitzschia inconspicua]KAG7374897.1 hypothetical protein IV203_013992 [Nitzschia inconspicua]